MIRLLVIAVLVVLHSIATEQVPAGGPAYTAALLRVAKAAQIRAYLDESQSKCDNFYNYACGQWKRLRPASAERPKTAYLDQLQDLYVRKSTDMLNGDLGHDIQTQTGDAEVDKMLNSFYNSCRNSDVIKRIGLEPILNMVNFKGDWPKVHSESWYNYDYDWLRVIAEMRGKLGVDILVGLEIISDFEDKDAHRIKVGAPKLALHSKSAYLNDDNDDLRLEYKEGITAKLKHYFPEMSDDWAMSVAQQVLSIEQQLAKGLPDNEKLTLKQTTRQRNAAELKAAYGNFVDLSRYMNIIFNQTIYVQVYETPEDYMNNLVEVIRDTPKLALANYTMWRVLERFDEGGDNSWCMRKVIDYFPHQLESMFHRNYNSMQMTNELRTVFNDIKQEFRKELMDTYQPHWISMETLEKAVVKLNNMELEIVMHRDDNEMFKRNSYGVLRLHSERYYHNMIKILEWQTAQQLAKLLEKSTPTAVEVTLPKYEHTLNKLLVPITFLQSRFFWDAAYPNALKYSTIGFFMAQQMLHGFDRVGSKYDHRGYQRHWWDAASENVFTQRSDCFEQQTADASFQGKTVKDPNALSTSIVDNGGLGIAYRTYQQWLDNQSHSSNETLTNLNFNANHLFYLGFAQLWCADYHKSVESFTELPEELRVNNALSNFGYFSKDMGCDAKSPMNREKKCVLY